MNVKAVEQQLKAAEALWNQRGPSVYSLNVTTGGDWDHFYLRLYVKQGVSAKLTELRVLSNPPSEYRQQLERQLRNQGDLLARRFTVNALFGQIHNIIALHSTRDTVNACGVFKVAFDAKDGHPRSLKYDLASAMDEEFSYTISPLNP